MLLNKIFQIFESIGIRWQAYKLKKQALILLALYFLKNGINFEVGNIRDAYLPASQALPKPIGYFSASLGNLIIAKFLGIKTIDSWVALHALLLILSFILIVALILNNSIYNKSDLLLIVFTLSSLQTLTGTLGKYDVLTFFGGCCLILAKSEIVASCGAIILILGNPEQAIIATFCLLLLSANTEFKVWRKRALTALSLSCLIYLFIQFWMLNNAIISNRLTLIPYYLQLSVNHFLNNPTSSIWAWLGLGWIPLIFTLVHFKNKSFFVNWFPLLVVPTVLTLITADGARVFSLLILPSYLVVSMWFWKNLTNNHIHKSIFIGIYLFFWTIIPTSSDWGLLGRTFSRLSDALLSPLSEFALNVSQNLLN